VAQFADVSIEVGHFYPDEASTEGIVTAAEIAAEWARPWIERYRNQRRLVSTCVLIDDYFVAAPSGLDPVAAATAIVEACATCGLEIDHVVWEADCADSVEQLVSRLRAEPVPGAGSQHEPLDKIGWLANGARVESNQRPRERMAGRPTINETDTPVQHAAQFGRRQHSIFLDVELWSEQPNGQRIWACSLLAAWWQLIRLGMLRDSQGWPRAPQRTESRQNAPPLAARRTVTLLSPDFLEVEHAVRSILSHVDCPAEWIADLRDSPDLPSPTSHLDRIAYMFQSERFDPELIAR
jgi:hypothetical protein